MHFEEPDQEKNMLPLNLENKIDVVSLSLVQPTIVMQ